MTTKYSHSLLSSSRIQSSCRSVALRSEDIAKKSSQNKKNNQLPECPRNLIIVSNSKMRRSYRGKDGNMKEGTFSYVYFHLSDKCVEKQDPYFITSLVFCPTDFRLASISYLPRGKEASLYWFKRTIVNVSSKHKV